MTFLKLNEKRPKEDVILYKIKKASCPALNVFTTE